MGRCSCMLIARTRYTMRWVCASSPCFTSHLPDFVFLRLSFKVSLSTQNRRCRMMYCAACSNGPSLVDRNGMPDLWVELQSGRVGRWGFGCEWTFAEAFDGLGGTEKSLIAGCRWLSSILVKFDKCVRYRPCQGTWSWRSWKVNDAQSIRVWAGQV